MHRLGDVQTLALTVASFSDLVLAFGMHACPEVHPLLSLSLTLSLSLSLSVSLSLSLSLFYIYIHIYIYKYI